MLGFVFALIVFFVAGLFVSNVAQEKGYNGFVVLDIFGLTLSRAVGLVIT